jgi:hypothetical protein
VPNLLDGLSFLPGGSQRQGPFLFIGAEDCFVLGRLQVQTEDLFGLGCKVRIRAGHVPSQLRRLQPAFCQTRMTVTLLEPKRRASQRVEK